jgi:tetratricopeptide (TPR) repeat protein
MAMLESRLPGIIEKFERANDDRGLARAHFASMLAHVLASEQTHWAEHAVLAADYARRAGDEGLRARALSWYISALYHGLESVETVRSAIDAADHHDNGAYLAGGIDAGRGWMALAEGDFQQARMYVQRQIDQCTELGALTLAAGAYQDLGSIEFAAGDPAAARAWLQRGDRLLAELGEQSYRSTVQAMLAFANALLGDREAATSAVEEAEPLSAAEDALNFIYTHMVRSALALTDGDLDAAERWARTARDIAYRTQGADQRGGANLQLARALAAQGRLEEAVEVARAALDVFERRGDLPRSAQARAELAALGA